MEKNYEIIEAKKNGFLLVYKKYLFVAERKKHDSTYYKCRLRSCKARGVLSADHFKESETAHNHENDEAAIIRVETRQKLIKKAKEDATVPTHQVYHKVINDERRRLTREQYSEEFIANALPTFQFSRSAIARSRREILPAQPQRREDIDVTGDWCLFEEESFVLINDGECDKILAFASKENFPLIGEAERIFMDGTFYVCPSLFSQLYTFHVIYRGQMVPVIYALLPNKCEATYMRLLKKIQEVAPEFGIVFQPRMVTMDFELAAINAVQQLFPAAEVKGCFFHFTQCIWRKTQEHGLQTAYETIPDVKTTVKRMSALPLLNPLDVDDAWLVIHSEAPQVPGMEGLIEYFVTTWLDAGVCIYDISIWNLYGVPGDRTNNKIEGWHSGLKKLVKKAHPNLYEFVEYLKQDCANAVSTIMHLRNGEPPKVQDKKYRKVNIAIHNLINMYNLGQKTPIQFLDTVSLKFNLKS